MVALRRPAARRSASRMIDVDDCVFCRIAAGGLPANVVHETPATVAFRDIAPMAPVHVLVIPRAHHRDLTALAEADPVLAGEVLTAAGEVARAEGLSAGGYRVIFNAGRHAGQEVFHVHAHVVGGAPLGPMLAR
jgi:histidine triad (HIT) family protein